MKLYNITGGHLILVLFCIPTSVFGCHRFKPSQRQLHNHDPQGQYSFIGGTFPRRCLDVREPSHLESRRMIIDESQSTHFLDDSGNEHDDDDDDSIISTTCNDLPPGLAFIEHGYVSTTLQSFKVRRRANVLRLTCSTKTNNLRKWKSYSVPDELSFINDISNGYQYTRQLDGVNSTLQQCRKDGLLDDRFLVELGNIGLKDPLKDLSEAEYMTREYHSYEVGIGEATPTPALLRGYNRLDLNLSRSYKDYHDFMDRFGSHVLKTVVFGGKYSALVGLRKRRAAAATPILVLTEGGRSNIFNEKDWERSVKRYPVPLVAGDIPIPEFIEGSHSPRSLRRQNFEEVMELQGRTQYFRKLLAELNVLGGNRNHTLSIFLSKSLQQEIPHLCPSENLYDLLLSGIHGRGNLQLDKFGIECRSNDLYLPKKHQHVTYTLHFRLLPGLCFTHREKFVVCKSPKIYFPEGVECIKFFKWEDCAGEDIRRVNVSYEEEQLEEAVLNSKSFAFC